MGYAPCPGCGSSEATSVGWSWWGGILGPAIFSHVKCNKCGTKYNGRTGKSNTTAIVIYSVVVMAIVLVISLALGE